MHRRIIYVVGLSLLMLISFLNFEYSLSNVEANNNEVDIKKLEKEVKKNSEKYQEQKDSIESEIEELEDNVDKNKREQEKIKKKIDSINETMSELEEEIIEESNKIDKTEDRINDLKTEIDHLNMEIKQKEIELKEKQKELEKQKEILGQSLSFIYENRDLSIYEFIFSSDKLSEIINSFDFMNIIADENDIVHKRIQKEEKEIIELKDKISKQKEDVSDKLNKQEKLKKQQIKNKEKLNSLLDEQSENQKLAEQELRDAEVLEEKAMDQIMEFIEEKEDILKQEAEEQKNLDKQKELERLRKLEEERKKSNTGTDGSPGPNYVQKASKSGLQNPMKPGTFRISSEYGGRIHPTTGETTHHNGIDLAAPIGTPIYASASGTVVYAGSASGFGNWIVIAHDNGLYTIYGHMRSEHIYVSPGQHVKSGQHIAGVGSEGMSTGPHLHFEVATSRSGRSFNKTNPRGYVDFSK